MWWWWHPSHFRWFPWKFGWLIWPLGWLVYIGVVKGVIFISSNPIIIGLAIALAIPSLFLGMGIQLVKGWQQNNSGPLKLKNETLAKRKNDEDTPHHYMRSDDGELIEIT
ncbi:MAG: hypothetical protein HY862_21145 [Chloroflexi bacterium]|nr:hypothetical protein [Chloroflexota bacterium]